MSPENRGAAKDNSQQEFDLSRIEALAKGVLMSMSSESVICQRADRYYSVTESRWVTQSEARSRYPDELPLDPSENPHIGDGVGCYGRAYDD